MDKLYAPWRSKYVMSQIKGCVDGACIFCELFDKQEPDEKRYVLYKTENLVVILNLYPYNGGHLLVIPRAHVQNMHELADLVLAHMIKISAVSCQILKQALACEAINFGANIGRIAGAGIPEHLHLHVLPRFSGDTGFFTTIGESKQVSVDLADVYSALCPHFKTLNI